MILFARRWSETPISRKRRRRHFVTLAWGSVFSALEVVPLVLVGFDAMDDLRRSRTSIWVRRYKWPIYFFISVAFWKMMGAGLFGFMINPPIALYYMQGLNTTPLHGRISANTDNAELALDAHSRRHAVLSGRRGARNLRRRIKDRALPADE